MENNIEEIEIAETVKKLRQLRKDYFEINKINLANKQAMKAVQTLHWQYKPIRDNQYYKDLYKKLKISYTCSKSMLWRKGFDIKLLKCRLKDQQRIYQKVINEVKK